MMNWKTVEPLDQAAKNTWENFYIAILDFNTNGKIELRDEKLRKIKIEWDVFTVLMDAKTKIEQIRNITMPKPPSPINFSERVQF